jgi:hypothetical protein
LEGGEQELDAGDVVAVMARSRAAWRLGKWPPGPGKRRGSRAGGGGGTGERRGGRWRLGRLAGVKRRWQQRAAEQSRAEQLEVDDRDPVAIIQKFRGSL